MAEVIDVANLTGNIASNFADKLISIPGMDLIIKSAQVLLVLIIIYLIFLIIKSFSAIKTNFRIKKICINVEQINQKLDHLVTNKTKKKK